MFRYSLKRHRKGLSLLGWEKRRRFEKQNSVLKCLPRTVYPRQQKKKNRNQAKEKAAHTQSPQQQVTLMYQTLLRILSPCSRSKEVSKAEAAQLSNGRPGLARRHWKLCMVLTLPLPEGSPGGLQPEWLRLPLPGLLLLQSPGLPNFLFQKTCPDWRSVGSRDVGDFLQGHHYARPGIASTPYSCTGGTTGVQGQAGAMRICVTEAHT